MRRGSAQKMCMPPQPISDRDPFARLYYAIRDQSVLANPFAFLGSPSFEGNVVPITPGTPEFLFKNDFGVPSVLAVQAPGSSSGQRSYLILSTDKTSCALGSAKQQLHEVAPRLSIILAPNEAIWADATDPDGASAVQSVRWVAVPLHGTIFEF